MSKTRITAIGNKDKGYSGTIIGIIELTVWICPHKHKTPTEARKCTESKEALEAIKDFIEVG